MLLGRGNCVFKLERQYDWVNKNFHIVVIRRDGRLSGEYATRLLRSQLEQLIYIRKGATPSK